VLTHGSTFGLTAFAASPAVQVLQRCLPAPAFVSITSFPVTFASITSFPVTFVSITSFPVTFVSITSFPVTFVGGRTVSPYQLLAILSHAFSAGARGRAGVSRERRAALPAAADPPGNAPAEPPLSATRFSGVARL